MYLADRGADVVKIEQPTGGDASRTTYGAQLGGESVVFVAVNRNSSSRHPSAPAASARSTRRFASTGRRANIRTPAPGLGEHTDTVLSEAGLTPADLADLRKSGAIG